MMVAGMLLPTVLVTAIEQGAWRVPADASRLQAVFKSEVVDPRFYSLQGIFSETRRWHSLSDVEVLAQYLGEPSLSAPPGDVVQDKSIFIGDLGPDMPFALDCRKADREPPVIILTVHSGWRQVSPSVADLMAALGLNGVA